MWMSIAIMVFAATVTSARPVATPEIIRCTPTLGILANLTVLGVSDHNAGFRWDIDVARGSPTHGIEFVVELFTKSERTDRLRFRNGNKRLACSLDGLLPDTWYILKVEAVYKKGARCRVSNNFIWTTFRTLRQGASHFPSWFTPLHVKEAHRQRHGRKLLVFSQKKGNKIVINHNFLISSSGVVNYYELLVFRNDSDAFISEVQHVPRLTGVPYKISPEEEYGPRARFAEALRHSLFGDWRPNTPMDIMIVEMTQKWIRLAIVFRPPHVTTDVHGEPAEYWKPPKLRLSCGLADFLNFTRYKPVQYRVRRCTTHSWRTNDPCGPPVNWTLMSNVGVPSPVSNPSLSLNGNRLLIRWEQPEEPNGPIDGYVLKIQTTAEGRRRTDTVHVPHEPDPYYEIANYRRLAAYIIEIAAFNNDMEDATIQHTGKWVLISPPDTFVFHHMQQIVIIALITLMVVLILFITCLCCEKMSHRVEKDMELPPLVHPE